MPTYHLFKTAEKSCAWKEGAPGYHFCGVRDYNSGKVYTWWIWLGKKFLGTAERRIDGKWASRYGKTVKNFYGVPQKTLVDTAKWLLKNGCYVN